MKSLSLVVAVGFAAASLVACGGAPEESMEPAEVAQEDLASQEQGAHNGQWCFSNCYNGLIYAGPNVTQNCTSWAEMVCRHRGTTLFNAYWAPPHYYADYYL
ncbi:hypothetical protein [Pyxidicoccus xibeiensis]|uniref:hypothetical protein n=1 Tax=Pyxidicoccus xibeiensis TaxID=2906759 RepID=UPI0020A7CB7E|nr:hypothetical protein [Pyxidicoccus xibeiensis]MCP3140549.1 hypothetical protein [Pyxidicoccus xibeiensis]